LTRTLLDITVHLDDDVYRPSEDTMMTANLVEASPGDRCVDLCAGSGLIALVFARQAGRSIAADLDPEACKLARRNAQANELDLDVVQADLARGLEGPFDRISCNPPYLPTGPEDNDVETGIDVDGGPDGAELARRMIDELPRLLADDGQAWMLVSTLQPLEELETQIADNGLTKQVADEETMSRFERLEVWHIQHA